MENNNNIDYANYQELLNIYADELERMAKLCRRGIFSFSDLTAALTKNAVMANDAAEQMGEYND